MEGHFLSDVFLHSAVSHQIRERHHTLLIGKMVSVLIQKFGLQHGFECVLDVAQSDRLSLRVNGKIIGKHLHTAVVIPFDFLDMIRTVGKGSQGIVRLRIDSEPEPSGICLLSGSPLGSAVKISVFICCKPVFFYFFSVPVIGSDLKSHPCHPLLGISADLADGKISAHDAVLSRCVCG